MTTDAITMEILAGSTDPVRISSWERLLASCTLLHQEPLDDALSAARPYRDCRRAGETPRTLMDCLIAAVAIRNEVPVLHRDRDFDVIARHSDLQVARP
jgi:predicted nucleic acid-binding protein